jgi:glycosyltransferase involved in cell wall biosynthesis
MKISYAITVCNELDEITKLLNFLQLNIRKEDEIVIQYDESSVTSEVKEYISLMDMMHENHNVIGFPLNKDFASFKNNLKSNCSGDYIFQIDADEMPDWYLMQYLPEILQFNPDNEVYLVPRVNTVDGLTQEHIKKWGWNVNDKGWINWPDYQWRIWKNKPEIKWKNKVHEQLEGFKTYAPIPADEKLALSHPKSIDRQERQNSYYDTL